jgi:hypothetical protein
MSERLRDAEMLALFACIFTIFSILLLRVSEVIPWPIVSFIVRFLGWWMSIPCVVIVINLVAWLTPLGKFEPEPDAD